MKDDDYLYRFLFEGFGVRGGFVRLAASWQAVRERHLYPPAAERQLGAALAAVALLSATIKFKGSLSLQLHGDGEVRSLLAQATEQRTVRGMLSIRGDAARGASLKALLGAGRMVLTAEAPSGELYQGIVPLEGEELVDVIQGYFDQSEQLPTRLWLAAGPDSASGLLLQRLPGQGDADADGWNRVTLLADTMTEQELQSLDVRTLLHRLFNAEDLRLFDPEPVAFRCGCSRERLASVLVSLGRTEVESIIDEQGAVEANCEFCRASYRFDRVDAAALFTDGPLPAVPETRQ